MLLQSSLGRGELHRGLGDFEARILKMKEDGSGSEQGGTSSVQSNDMAAPMLDIEQCDENGDEVLPDTDETAHYRE